MDCNMTYHNLTEFRKNQVKENKKFLDNKLFLEFGVFKGNSILEYYSAYLDNNIRAFDYFLEIIFFLIRNMLQILDQPPHIS